MLQSIECDAFIIIWEHYLAIVVWHAGQWCLSRATWRCVTIELAFVFMHRIVYTT